MSVVRNLIRRSLPAPKLPGSPFLVSLCIMLALNAFVAAAVYAVPPQTIHVVMDDNYPPYVFKGERGELKGIIVDQWRLWEKQTGIKAELTGMDWGEAQRRMQAGEFDVIDTIFKTENRGKIYVFTKSYARLDVPLFFHMDISGIRSPEDAKGFLVAAKDGDASVDFLRKQGVANIQLYSSYEKIIEAARDDKVKVFTVDSPPGRYFLNKLGIQGRFRTTSPMYSGEFHRAVLKDRRELLATLEKGFAAIPEAELKAIDKRWMGTPVVRQTDLRYLVYAAGIVCVSVVVVAVWILSLRRVVRRKTAELAESEERYRSIIENMQDVFYRADAEGHLTMLSPSGADLLGYDSPEQMLGMIIRDTFYFDPVERDAFVNNLKLKGALSGYGVTLKRKDGTPLPVATSTHLLFDADGQFMGVEGVFRDVSEQLRSEAALRSSEERFSRAFSKAPLLMSISDIATGRYLEVNERFGLISGYTPEEVIGRTSIELGWLAAAERERLICALKHDGRIQDMELSLTARDGRAVVVLYSAEIIHVDGEDRLLSIALDITDRKQTEELLRESEERYRQLVEQSSAWIWQTDADLRHTYSNDNVHRILGYSAEELCAMDTLDLVHPDDHEKFRKTAEGAISARRGWNGLVLRWLARDGSWHSVESSGIPVFDEADTFVGLQGIDTDITDRLQLEQERVKAQRLESLGVLAGGIAHDFNNILTGIIGNLSLARAMAEDGRRVAGRLEECEKAALRASELTRQLLTFARGGEPVKKIEDVRRLVTEAVSFSLVGTNVKGVLNLSDDLWNLEVDAGQINQVLNNLLINAVQAMPAGGAVAISATNTHLPEAGRPGVQITIADSGCGIPADVLPHIFDPYFSTKAYGTGLGLASVYSIVTRHGGTISVTSEPGRGSEFTLLLPAVIVDGSAAPEPEIPHKPACPAEHVLIMDDEEMIRDVAGMMLVEIGCRVDQCADGAAAVEMYRRSFEGGQRYDLVILDLTVPGGMGGLEAARHIRELDPDAVLIVSSGYSHDAVLSDLSGHGFSGAVMKPYSMNALIAEIERVTAARRADRGDT